MSPIKSVLTTKQRKITSRSRTKKYRRKRCFSDASHDELLRKVQERYGGDGRKSKDERKEPTLNTSNGVISNPATYQRMMQRALEAHLNRLLQPETPRDLLPSHWICALCFKPSGADYLGELFGPYFIRLSSNCQPPEKLVTQKLLVEYQQENAKKMNVGNQEGQQQPSTSTQSLFTTYKNRTVFTSQQNTSLSASSSNDKKRNSKNDKVKLNSSLLEGSIDIWMHGQCALWTPELYLVGGRFPTLQKNIQRYWHEKCTYCNQFGATIPISNSTKIEFESPLVASNGLLKEKHCRKGKESQSVSSPPQFPFTSKQYNTSEFCWRNYQQQTFVSSKQQCYTHYICAVLNDCHMDEDSFRCRPSSSD